MSSLLLKVLILAALSAVAFSQIQCYFTPQNSYSLTQQWCPYSRYCQKNYYKDSSQALPTRGCSNVCAKSGCFNDGRGYGHCCCSTNLCNSVDSKFSTGSMIMTAISLVYLGI